MTITALPTPPTRNDPINFADRGDLFMAALPVFVTEVNALEVNVMQKEVDAAASAAAALLSEQHALASENAANSLTNVVLWVSGTTYAQGVCVWSPTNFLTYRRKVAGAGTTDPSSDSTNWAQVLALPSQNTHAGKVLKTDGTNVSWLNYLDSPIFINIPVAPTAAYSTNTTQLATTAFVQGEKVSPTFSGTPAAPTAAAGTNSTQIATTAFVTTAAIGPIRSRAYFYGNF